MRRQQQTPQSCFRRRAPRAPQNESLIPDIHFANRSRLSFNERCYALVRRVPHGKLTTYSAIAHALGSKAYRAVGSAMNKNPYAPIVPCHRVINKDGSLGGYADGTSAKIKILKAEGISVKNGKVLDFEKHLYLFRK